MQVGVPKETTDNEKRISLSPAVAKKLIKKGLEVAVESGAGLNSGFVDKDYTDAGAKIVDRSAAFGSDIVLKINRPTDEDLSLFSPNSLLVCLVDPFGGESFFNSLAQKSVNCLGLELIPRTSRAQSMDVLSSQANIGGYRAVLEATQHYGRFFPMMMTSAGMAKPSRVIVLGAGVAGLQAIATAKRLGAVVEAFDVRPEVKEQIESLGAKFIELDIGEAGSGEGGYAKELSDEAKKKQQAALTERLKTADIVISTANIPGRKAPILITREAVEGMKYGSVIVDMAAATGGNCELTDAGQITSKEGVTIIGLTNYPALMPADASNFFGNNLVNLLNLLIENKDGKVSLKYDLEDDIIDAALVTYEGKNRFKR